MRETIEVNLLGKETKLMMFNVTWSVLKRMTTVCPTDSMSHVKHVKLFQFSIILTKWNLYLIRQHTLVLYVDRECLFSVIESEVQIKYSTISVIQAEKLKDEA